AHEDADAIDLLPLFPQAQESADFEVSRGDVDGLREPAPVAQIAEDLPVGVAVIDDEQFAAGLALARRHGMDPEGLAQMNMGGRRLRIECKHLLPVFIRDSRWLQAKTNDYGRSSSSDGQAAAA